MAKQKGKAKTTNIYFVIDRSGSMQPMAAEAIGGFNTFVAEQQKLPGKANLTLVQFDNAYEIVHDAIDVKTVPVLTAEVYYPRGMTALYDAVGRTITKGIATSKEGEKNILVILTDGFENASQEYTHASLTVLMKKAQEELGWEVIFLGANMDAKHVAGGLGINLKNVATFDNSAKGAKDAITTMSFAASAYRSAAVGGQLSAAAASFVNNADADLNDVYASIKSGADVKATDTFASA
jgi:hypothetical protein